MTERVDDIERERWMSERMNDQEREGKRNGRERIDLMAQVRE